MLGILWYNVRSKTPMCSKYFSKLNILPSTPKKPLQNKVFLAFFTPVLLFTISPISNSSALSFDGFMNSVKDTFSFVRAQENDKKEVREENVQSLKVFEAEKNLKAVSLEKEMPKPTLNNDNISLEVGKENFYAGESLDNEDESVLHNDNAIYKVRTGESIYSIASYFGISAETILSYNKITEKQVKEGLVLEVPPTSGISYEIRKGDTLGKLASKFKIDIDDLTLINGFSEDEELDIGDEVFLPGVKEEKKDKEKTKTKSKTPIKAKAVSIASLGDLAKYAKNLGRGSTAQFNKLSDIKKYFNLPKFPNYYIHPAPGTNRTQTMHGHNGSDFAGKIGTPILAAAGGTVKVAKSSGYNYGYGNYVIIVHDNGTQTVYAHMSAVKVAQGQQVAKGQIIGALGSSGNSTGPHLHFEIRGGFNPWAW